MKSPYQPRKMALLAATGAVMAIAALGTASYAGATQDATVQPNGSSVYCEVLATPSGSGITLQAVFHADQATFGSYRLSVDSVGGGNSSSINQGGDFQADGAGLVPLGTVTMGGNATYDISLKVTENGVVHSCGGNYAA